MNKSYELELQQRMRELQESEARFRAIYNNVNDAIFVHDLETGAIVDINQRVCELYGYTRDEILQLDVGTLSSGEPPYDMDHAYDLMQKASAGEPQTSEWCARDKAGKFFWVEVSLRRAKVGGEERLLIVVRDITDRKRAEQALKKSEEKYRELVQNANSIILRWNCEGIVTFFNEFAQSFFGYSEEEIVGKNVVGTIVPETDTAGTDLTELMMDICNNPQYYGTNVNENMLKDGRKVWIAWTNKPVLDEDQKLVEVLSVGIDVTQQRRDSEALRESTQMLNLVFDTVPARVFWKNKDLVYMGCSRLFAIDAGVGSPSGIVGKTDFDMPWKDTEAGKYQADDRLVMETGISKLNFEETQFTAEGRIIWVITSKVPLKDAEGQVIGVLGTYEDITERKTAELSLRKSEVRFRTLFDRAADALYLADQSGRFVEVNKAACDNLGYTHDELIQLMVHDVVVNYSQADLIAQWAELVEKGAATVYVDHRRKDGTIFPVEGRLSLFEYGDQTHILAVVRDITERKRAEEAIKRRGRQLEILSDTSRRLNAVLEIPTVMRELVASALELCDARSGAAALIADGKLVLEEYNRDGNLVPIQYEFVPGYGVPGHVMETREPYVSNDAEQDPYVIPEIREFMGFYNLADVPIISRSGELLGCFEIHNTRDRRPFDDTDVRMLEGLAASVAVAIENARMLIERQREEEERRALEQRVEEQKRQFYRETILSVTGGKLDICESGTLAPYLQNSEMAVEVNTALQIPDARHRIENFCRQHGLSEKRVGAFMTGVGEAITNAVKHGREGMVYAGTMGENIWVAIEDHGTGIDSLVLPRAVLLRGYSTKPSLGLGYSVMLDVADQIHLKTDEYGTTVVLEKRINEPKVDLSIQDLLEVWDKIPDQAYT